MRIFKIIIGIWLILALCGLFIVYILMNNFKSSNACKAAFEYLKKDSFLISKIGKVKGFGFFVSGGLKHCDNSHEGTASYYICVKGEIKNQKVFITLDCEANDSWQVVKMDLIAEE